MFTTDFNIWRWRHGIVDRCKRLYSLAPGDIGKTESGMVGVSRCSEDGRHYTSSYYTGDIDIPSAYTSFCNLSLGLTIGSIGTSIRVSLICCGAEHLVIAVGYPNVGLYVMGRNTFGQLAIDTDTCKSIQTPTFRPVDTICKGLVLSEDSHIEAVQCGTHHTVCLITNAKHTSAVSYRNVLLSWGRNNVGQLGHGISSPSEWLPRVIEGLLFEDDSIEVCGVFSGWYHNIALTTNDVVYSWGCNLQGTLGLGTVSPYEATPQRVDYFAESPLKIGDASCGRWTSLFVTSDGQNVYRAGNRPNCLHHPKSFRSVELNFKINNENLIDDCLTSQDSSVHVTSENCKITSESGNCKITSESGNCKITSESGDVSICNYLIGCWTRNQWNASGKYMFDIDDGYSNDPVSDYDSDTSDDKVIPPFGRCASPMNVDWLPGTIRSVSAGEYYDAAIVEQGYECTKRKLLLFIWGGIPNALLKSPSDGIITNNGCFVHNNQKSSKRRRKISSESAVNSNRLNEDDSNRLNEDDSNRLNEDSFHIAAFVYKDVSALYQQLDQNELRKSIICYAARDSTFVAIRDDCILTTIDDDHIRTKQ